MKKNLLKLLAVISLPLLLTYCKSNEPTPSSTPSVSISASKTSLDEGGATLSLTLSETAAKEVGVTLKTSGSLAAALSIPTSVTIPAGERSASVDVTPDLSKLAPGDYNATVSIEGVSGATVVTEHSSVQFTLNVGEPETTTVNLTADGDFVNYTASVNITLTNSLSEDVTVTLATGSNTEDYPVIPDESLTYEKTFTIEAGKTTKSLTVTVDPSALPYGESVASIVISAVSDNAVIGNNNQVDIVLTRELEANLRSDWGVSYDGKEEKDEGTFSVITISGVGDEENYFCYIYRKGLVAENFETTVDYLRYMSTYIDRVIGTEDAPSLRTGSGSILYNISVGEYEVWILGCDANGSLNGDYTTAEISVEATAEELEAYESWLGEWTIQRGSYTDKWEIYENVPGASFYIRGVDGYNMEIHDIFIEAEYDTAYDALVLYTQDDLKDIEISNAAYSIGLYGMGGGYIITGDYYICFLTKTDEDTATFTGNDEIVLSDGTPVEITTLTLYATNASSNEGYVFNGQEFYDFSTAQLKRVVPVEGDPGYESFLGYWNIEREGSEWDSSARKYISTGTVTDTWHIEERIPGVDYYIWNVEGFTSEEIIDDPIPVVADYDSETGTFSIIEDYMLFASDGNLMLCGIFNYQGKSYYCGSGEKLTVASIDGDQISMTSETFDYGNFSQMKILFEAEDGVYSFHQDGTPLPNTLVRTSEPSSVKGNRAPGRKITGKSNIRPGKPATAFKPYDPNRRSVAKSSFGVQTNEFTRQPKSLR